MDKALFVSSLSSLIARGSVLLSQFLVTALLSRRYSLECLGVAMIIGNFVYFIGLFDLGIGGAPLRNHLAKLAALGSDQKRAKSLFFSLFQISLLIHLALILLLLFPLDWVSLFSLKEPLLTQNAGRLFTGALFLLLVRAPLFLAHSGFFAYHMVPQKALFEILEALALLFCAAFSPSFSCFILSSQLFSLIMTLSSFLFFLKRRGWRYAYIPLREAFLHLKRLLPDTLSFWFLNLFHLLLSSQLPFLIALLISAEAAGHYTLVHRLFSLLLGVHFTLLNPLWSSYTAAASQNRWLWVQKHLKISTRFTCALFSFGILFLIFFHRLLILLWTGRIVDDPQMLIATGFWAVVYGLGNNYAILLNGLGRVKPQIVSLMGGGLISFFCAPLIAKQWGATGVVLASGGALLPYVFATRYLAKKICASSSSNSATSAMLS